MSGVVYGLYREAIAKAMDPITALWKAKEYAERLEQELARNRPFADAFLSIETVLGQGTDALCRTADGQWALIDQGGELVVKVPTLLDLGRACAPEADRVHRERNAQRVRDMRGRDHYAWRGERA
jgi:hypothetical protein